jgi:predicted flap endonuclease-1-like 5' DNA nuclease
VEPLRLRALSAAVAGLVAVAVIAVVGMIVGESALDADPSAVELAALVVPVALLAALGGFVVGWLWRLWWPGTRTVAELQRSAADLAAAREQIAELETRSVPVAEVAVAAAADDEDSDQDDDSPAGDAEADRGPEVDAVATPADEPASRAPVAGSEAPTSPTAEPEAVEPPAPALTMDEIPTIEIDQATAAAQVAERFGGGDPIRHDDLKLIRGVGPVMERLLNEMNVRTFEQVASFTGEDVAVVSAALEAFPDRIVRDDWVGQAKAFAARIKSG